MKKCAIFSLCALVCAFAFSGCGSSSIEDHEYEYLYTYKVRAIDSIVFSNDVFTLAKGVIITYKTNGNAEAVDSAVVADNVWVHSYATTAFPTIHGVRVRLLPLDSVTNLPDSIIYSLSIRASISASVYYGGENLGDTYASKQFYDASGSAGMMTSVIKSHPVDSLGFIYYATGERKDTVYFSHP